MPDWWIVVAVALGIALLVLVPLYVWRTKARVKGIKLPWGIGIDFDHDKSPVAEVSPGALPSIPQIFEKSDGVPFTVCAEQLLNGAKRVVLIGTGLNLLQKESIFTDLTRRAARGDCVVEVFMANPWSPDVMTRLIEEELGPNKPAIGRNGLISRLATILHELKSREWPANFSLSLFWHYPTFAVCIIDGHYFSYTYGYALLGNFSPVEHYTKESKEHLPMIDFFEKHYERVKKASADARLVFGVRRPEVQEHVSADQLKAFAVYIVPDGDEPLYALGSSILGYDIREQRRRDTRWRAEVGSAWQFGMHLTVADALYFSSRSEIDRVQKELEVLLEDFPRFSLTDLAIEPGFPDERSISIRCRDRRGALESLHCELVATVYRRAIASNYTLGLAGRRYQPNGATDLMLSRYRAPYILSRFRPHFSLLTDVAPDRLDAAAAELGARFDEVPKQLEVSKIALMTQPSPGAPWKIEHEIPLH